MPPIRRLAASVTCRFRYRARGRRRRSPFLRPAAFPPHSPLPAPAGFVRGFKGTTQPSDSSWLPRQLRLLGFLPWPGIAVATAGAMRSPKFRRNPFARDVAFDPDGASAPRMPAPHMLPSATVTASAPAIFGISWLNPTPRTIAVYALPRSSPSPTQHSLPGGRCSLPGPDLHRLDRASFLAHHCHRYCDRYCVTVMNCTEVHP
jgi:hypothetical protein